MLVNIPLLQQSNAPLSKSAKGIEETEKVPGKFSKTLLAVAADLGNSRDCPKGVSKEIMGGNAKCKNGCEPSKGTGPEGDHEKRLSQSDTSEETARTVETEMPSHETVFDREESGHSVESALLGGVLGSEENTETVTSEESLGEPAPKGNPENVVDIASLNQVTEKEGGREVPPSASAENPSRSFGVKQNRERATHVATPQLKVLEGMVSRSSDPGGKPAAVEVEGQSTRDMPTRDIFAIANGERTAEGEKASFINGNKGTKKIDGTIINMSRQGAFAAHTNEKGALKRAERLETIKTGFPKKSIKSALEPKMRNEDGILKKSGKQSLFIGQTGGFETSAEKSKGAIGTAGNERLTGFATRAENTATVQKSDNAQTGPKELNAAMENGKATGDNHFSTNSGVKEPGDKSIGARIAGAVSDFDRAVDGSKAGAKIPESVHQNPKHSSSTGGENVSRLQNVQEAEAPASKPDTKSREDQGDGEKRSPIQKKGLMGTLEKPEIAKGEEVPSASKLKTGPGNGASPAVTETEKEVPKSPAGKENLGTLVRTASFLLKNGRQEARMALHPESLGQLKIRIIAENNQVTVRVMAETGAAKELIEQNLHQLKADFQNQGLEISKFDVSLSQDSDRNSAGQNSFFASNRAKDRSNPKKEQNQMEREKPEQVVTIPGRMDHRDAVDLFA